MAAGLSCAVEDVVESFGLQSVGRRSTLRVRLSVAPAVRPGNLDALRL
jgi:hypothetical protein